MSGIYIHIPFCKQRCHYCDFYSTTQLKQKSNLVKAICQELIQRKAWLNGETVKTIYFGGGTPSLLTSDEIKKIIGTIENNYNLLQNAEITLEANPDDLSYEHIQALRSTPVNRLSIGIQSFNNNELELMHRRHNAEQVYRAISDCQYVGFNNISVDLIYGLPNSTLALWEANLKAITALNIQHLSAYHLTFEQNTVFGVKKNKGELFPIGEQASIDQFKILIQWAKTNNFVHYEISNFGKAGFFSQHNTSYWMQQKYLGVGPSAHSYNIDSRCWNVANLSTYIDKIKNKQITYDKEILTRIDIHNEFLITALRTRWGIDLNEFEIQFGLDIKNDLLSKADSFIKQGLLYINNNKLILSDQGIFISDSILAELMIVEYEN